jgi:hypothetical protein
MIDRRPALQPGWTASRRRFVQSVSVGTAAILLGGRVRGKQDAVGAVQENDGEGDLLDPDLCSPDDHDHTLDIDNQFTPFPVGRQLVLEGEEDGATIEFRMTVLDETEMVGDIETRVVEERESEDGELVEVSRNYFTQTEEGTVCYFGEAVDIYEDGEVVASEGAWRADESGNRPGIFMPADPEVGMRFAQEGAPGVAADEAEITARGETVEVPAGTFENTLRTLDRDPLTDAPGDEKVYAPDVGVIVDGPLELVAIIE